MQCLCLGCTERATSQGLSFFVSTERNLALSLVISNDKNKILSLLYLLFTILRLQILIIYENIFEQKQLLYGFFFQISNFNADNIFFLDSVYRYVPRIYRYIFISKYVILISCKLVIWTNYWKMSKISSGIVNLGSDLKYLVHSPIRNGHSSMATNIFSNYYPFISCTKPQKVQH